MLGSGFTISDLFLYNFVTDDKFPQSGPIVNIGNNGQMYHQEEWCCIFNDLQQPNKTERLYF